MSLNKPRVIYSTLACAALVAVLLSGCQSPGQNPAAAPAPSASSAPDPAPGDLSWPKAAEVREHMKAAFVPELKDALTSMQIEPTDWQLAAFYVGVSAAWQVTGDEDYHNSLEQWGKGVNWLPGSRARHADDWACGQVYLELYEREGGPERIAAIRERVDSFLASPQPGHVDWWWCDALYMAPSVFVKLSQATGDAHYRAALPALYWNAVQALWDAQEHLFYRDHRYVGQPEKVFWARGNGWVLAGLARILAALPADDPERGRYEQLFKTLAARVLQLQGADGAWRASLTNPNRFPAPESSGTALFAYAFAWGVNHHLLPRAEYAPAVLKAWAALERAQLPNGQLGGVQPVGRSPENVAPADTAPYGGGAFLLLGSELLPPPAPPATG
jgi:unsaturated rhamnogalacturonyl hydrolase